MATKTNVTKEFEELCQLLGPGEMVRSPDFELSKAISAIEFFSPKMDAGMVPKRPQPEELQLRTTDLSNPEISAIVDRLWNLELCYYDGSSMAQSVFTCLYAHEVIFNKLKSASPVLYALIAATLRTCSRTQEIVIQSQVCFEEDFQIGTLGIAHCGESLSDEDCKQLLLEALSKTEDETLKSRLLFRSFLLEASQALDKFNFAQAESCLLQASNELSRCKIGSSKAQVDFAFDPLVNYWRLPPQPPRPTLTYDASTVLSRFLENIDSLFFVCQARHSVQNGNARGELLSLFDEVCQFSRTKRKVNAVGRSRMFLALCDEEKRAFGVAPWKSLVAKDVSLWGSDATSVYMDDLHTSLQASHNLFEVFRVLCFNPARQRRKLVHRIEDLGAFQQRCEQLDAQQMGWTQFNEWDIGRRQVERSNFTMSLGSWACEWCVRLMERFLELGSELQLYRSRECKSLMYYLYIIYRMQSMFRDGSLKKRNLKAEPETSTKNPFAHTLIRKSDCAELKRNLCIANVQLLIALHGYTKSKEADADVVFDFPSMHYEHRFFDPFSTVWLPVLFGYNEIEAAFSREVLSKRPLSDLILACNESFNKVKQLGQILLKKQETTKQGKRGEDEVKALVKCAIKNALGLMALQDAIKNEKDIKFSSTFDLLGDAVHVAISVEAIAPPPTSQVSASQ